MTQQKFEPKQIVIDLQDKLWGMVVKIYDKDTVEVVFEDGAKIFNDAQTELIIKSS